MRSPLLLSVAALVLSAFALGLALVSRDGTEPAGGESAPAARVDPELLARVHELSRRVDKLALRTLGLQVDEPVESVEAPVSARDLEVMRTEVLELLALQDVADDEARPGTPAFTRSVADALSEIRRQERQEAVQRAQDEREQQIEEKLVTYQEWLGLDGNQSLAMRQALGQRLDRKAEILRLWADGAADDVVNQHKQDDKQAFKEEISKFLTSEQIETYSEGWK